MNIYDSFFKNISPNDWEHFAADFLGYHGFLILKTPSVGQDGGSDLIVQKGFLTFVVSCKHFINSGRNVGVNDETSILDRINQHNANGFIGFYSTDVTSSLQERLDSLSKCGYIVSYFNRLTISNFIPFMGFSIIQKYLLPAGVSYYLNVAPGDYQPLNCVKCGKDVLQDEMIKSSLVQLSLNRQGEIEYIFGCKTCFLHVEEIGWASLHQLLFPDQLLGWNQCVNVAISDHSLSASFHERRGIFLERIQQKSYPNTWGQWL